MTYDATPLAALGALADAAADDLNGGQTAAGSMNRAMNSVAGFGYDLSIDFLAALPGVGEAATTAIGQLFGAIPNPHLTVAFSGPQFRLHKFNWRFAPRNAEDSKKIRSMVNEIRKRILSGKALTATANILTIPNMIRTTLSPKMEDGGNLFDFKIGVVPNINVNYTPLGYPSFFAGTKLPTLIDMSLDILEIEYFLSDDVGGKPGASLHLPDTMSAGGDSDTVGNLSQVFGQFGL